MELKKKKKEEKSYIDFYICSFCFLVCSVVFSQGALQTSPTVVAGCSGSLQGYSLVSLKSEFTLGQIAINYLPSDDFILTQGFHQPNLGVISIFEDKMTNISVYPNPMIDILNVDLVGYEAQTFEIINMLGQTVAKGRYTSTVDVSNLEM